MWLGDKIVKLKIDPTKFNGITITEDEINEEINKLEQENLVAQGRVHVAKLDMKLSWTTLSNYSVVLANKDGVSTCNTVIF